MYWKLFETLSNISLSELGDNQIRETFGLQGEIFYLLNIVISALNVSRYYGNKKEVQEEYNTVLMKSNASDAWYPIESVEYSD